VTEEIFGELQEIGHSEPARISTLPDGGGVLVGEVRLDEVNEEFNWNLHDEQVDTLAGFMMKTLGRIGRVGDIVETEFGTLKIEEMSKRRILKVLLSSQSPFRKQP
jgi:putative hemolysin